MAACLCLSTFALAQDQEARAAQKDLDYVFERPPGRIERQKALDRFEAFFKKYEGKDLGPLSHARGLYLYLQGDMDKAVASFDQYLGKYDAKKIKSREQRMMIGRVYLNAAVRGSRSGEMQDDRFVDLARKFARCYDDVQSVGHLVTRGLPADKKKLLARARVAMANEVLKKNLHPEETDAILESLYRDRQVRRARPARPATPKTLEPFIETAMSGEVIDLKAYRGQVVLVDFWATWCGPCLREMPSVVSAYEEYKSKGFTVIGISLDKPEAEKKIQAIAERFGMKWEQIYDGGAKLAKANGIRRIPLAFLIDRTGKVRFSGRQTRGDNLNPNIEKLLGEKVK